MKNPKRTNRVTDPESTEVSYAAEVAGCYGSNGNVSVDPVIIVKLMLCCFWIIFAASGS